MSTSVNRQLLVVGLTLGGAASGFFIQERVEAFYKEKRFQHFEQVFLSKQKQRRPSKEEGKDAAAGTSSSKQ